MKSVIIRSIFEHFEEHANLAPDKLAICSPHRQCSYGELNRQANRIAHALLATHVAAYQPVAILISDPIEAVAAIFGAQKARLIAMPLANGNPPERLQSIVERAQAPLLLTSESSTPQATLLLGQKIPSFNISHLPADIPEENPGLSVQLEDPAYIFHTSGSTGMPKSVVRSHGALVQSRLAFMEKERVHADDRFLLSGAVSFGGSTAPIYSALFSGAAFFPFDVAVGGFDGLRRWIQEKRLTVCQFTGPLFRNFIRTIPPSERFPDLRLVRLGGDTISPADVALVRRYFGSSCHAVITYAATEAGTIAGWELGPDAPLGSTSLPVGYVADGRQVFILDEAGQPLPPGQPGEIVVKSRYLALGYWNDPEATRKRFLPDPDGGPERIYHTGDLGRMRPDGLLEHLGRKDAQVKIRGYRVELSEVEAALQLLGNVQGAAVTVYPDASGEKSLIAFVATPDNVLPTALWRQTLAQRIPSYMIPSRFVRLGLLPLNTNGKIDRAALTKLALSLPPPETSAQSDAEQTSLEESRLARLWEKILDVPHVGRDDNYFDLGGQSLQAALMFSEIEKIWGVSLPPTVLMEAPTVEQLAGRLAQARGAFVPVCLVPIVREGRRPPFFCVPGGNGPGFNLRALASRLGPDQPVWALHMPEAMIPSTIEEWAGRFVTEIRTLQPHGPYFLGGHSFGGIVAYEMAHQLVAAGENIALLALIDAYGPGYPARLPFGRHLIHRWHNFRGRNTRDKFLMIPRSIPRLLRLAHVLPADGPFRGNLHGYSRFLRKYSLTPAPTHITLLRATVPEGWLGWSYEDPLNKWGTLGSHGITVFNIPGKHGSIVDPPTVDVLAVHLGIALRKEQKQD